MKITIRRVIIIIFVIAFSVNLYVLVTNVYSESQFIERDNLRPREGITVGHNDNFRMEEIAFYIINTEPTDSIMMRIGSTFLNTESEGKIGIYFPYNVKMKSDSSDWEIKSIEKGTAFLKKYSCNKEEYCITNYYEEYEFELVPENTKFDSKKGFKHGIKIKLDHVVPYEVDKFFREYNMRDDPLITSFNDTVKRQLTIIIPENVDSIHPIPIPDPDIFHNRGIDYSNTQLDWHVLKESQAFFVDYEIPEERKQLGITQANISLTGILMGVIVGLFGIALAIESTGKQPRIKFRKYGGSD